MKIVQRPKSGVTRPVEPRGDKNSTTVRRNSKTAGRETAQRERERDCEAGGRGTRHD